MWEIPNKCAAVSDDVATTALELGRVGLSFGSISLPSNTKF